MAKLEAESQDPDFWDDQEKAKEALKEKAALESTVTPFLALETGVIDGAEMLEMAREEGDKSLESEILESLKTWEVQLNQMEFKKMLGDPMDIKPAIMNINAGSGGTEACDWASILHRMYTRWAEKRGAKIEIEDYQAGDEAGIKSVTMTIDVPYAYGYLKSESGVHRLVRISPFDSGARRHTSFASVFVSPEVDDDIEIELNDAEIRVDTYRASGAGGQHINKTDSAVRMTHIPTNTVVQCQAERSQHKNRAKCIKMLKAKLYALEMEKRKAEQAATEGNKSEISWGSQIRSYVLQPYRLVKDHRTNFEKGTVDAILDGDLDEFMEAYLLFESGNAPQKKK